MVRGKAANQSRLGRRIAVVAEHAFHPIVDVRLGRVDFHRQREIRRGPARVNAPAGEQVVDRDGWIHEALQVPNRYRLVPRVFQKLHILPKHIGPRIHPGMGDVWDAVELQHDQLAGLSQRQGRSQVGKIPVQDRDRGRWNQQRVVPTRIIREPEFQRAVAAFGILATARKAIAQVPQPPQRLGTKAIAAPGETRRARHADFLQGVFDQGQFAREAAGGPRDRGVRMRPGMVADLEAHLMNLGDVLPGHKVLSVVHPAVGDVEGGVETQFLEQRRDERSMGFDRVVKGEDDALRAVRSARVCGGGGDGPTGRGHESAPGHWDRTSGIEPADSERRSGLPTPLALPTGVSFIAIRPIMSLAAHSCHYLFHEPRRRQGWLSLSLARRSTPD